MRTFEVLVSVQVKAGSFAGAEREIHRIMTAAFNESKGENPCNFDTLSMIKGEKVDQ